jgi:integrase
MANFRKVKSGWCVQVDRRGVYRSKTFPTKAEASAWAAREEAAILAGERGQFPNKTLAEAVDRYEREVTNTRPRTRRADHLRFVALLRDFPDLASKPLHKITADDIASWRDERLKKVSRSSVAREGQQFRPLWTLARKQWKWTGDSPWPDVKLPSAGHARTRRAQWSEVRAMLRSVGYDRNTPPKNAQQQTMWCYMLALHTAMRAGEVLRLSRSTVDLKRRVYRLDQHKTDEVIGPRVVPFTRRAARLLAVLDAAAAIAGRDNYFTINDASRDALFRKVRDRLMITGLRFHDSRGTALTWLSKRVDVMMLAKISGHRDINLLFNTYYRATAEEVAARL